MFATKFTLFEEPTTWNFVNRSVCEKVPLEVIAKVDELVRNVSNKIAEARYSIRDNADLGINCAGPGGMHRTFGFTLESAKASLIAASRGIANPVVVELGSGTGVNGIAALLANPTATYVGYEISPLSCDFSRQLINSYGLGNRAKIIKADFLESKLPQVSRADVVINENIHQMLYLEPQMAAANKILPKTHTATVYVPHKIAVTVTHEDIDAKKKTHFNIGNISLDKRHRGEIITHTTLSAEKLPHKGVLYASTLPADADGNLFFNPDEEIGELPMSSSVYHSTTPTAKEYRILVRTPVNNFMYPSCARSFICLPDDFHPDWG